MNSLQSARRDFLLMLSGSVGAGWLAANWPAMLSAAEHAHQAAKSSNPVLEVLTPEQARELDALTSCLIPTDDMPGAHEAGVVYFIDRALKTYASEQLPVYQKGLDAAQKYTAETFPGVARFSEASEEQKLKILTELTAESDLQKGVPRRGLPAGSTDFMRTLRFDAICGFLVDPEGGGNRDFAGWKVIGRDSAHNFAAPFGFYDKDYPGWQRAAPETEKK
jgi:gluconate 2-dehydrogenase gamma chain